MGHLTDSMFIMFALVIVVYIVGMSIYLILQQIKKLLNKRRDLKFQERSDRNG